tara:strand:- start:2128 stop:7563 length:5436 start_codon:yes stop_codon:yes gene_type:complete
MAKASNTFLKSKMNKDLDARIIPSGEYRNAVNVQVNKSEGEQVGSLENVLGNTKVADIGTHTGYAGTLHCIGQVVDDSNGIAYLFYTSSSLSINNYFTTDKNYIISFDSKSNSLVTLVEGAFLNLSTQNPIYGVNVLENLLFWTDNRNQPRKINLDLANPTEILNPVYYTTEDQISVAKYNPYDCIEMYAESSLSSGNYESTMKDVSSFYLPNGGEGVIQADVVAGATQVNLSTLEGDIVEAGGEYGAIGATVSYTTTSNPPEVIPVTGVTVDTFVYNDPVWEITVTGGTLPDLNATTQSIVLNSNPYYDKDYAGDPTYLEDKFVRFGYRFKFDDDEYSLFSTFTQSAFIPKQDGYFMYVKKPEAKNIEDVNDQDAAFRSTIVSFVENKVDNIKLRIPLPFNNYELKDSLKITSIDLLYKESDGIPVKVIDTIDISTVFGSAAICDVAADNLTPFTSVTVDNVRGGINVGDTVVGSGISTLVTVVSYTPDDPNQNPSISGIIELSSAQTLTEDTVLTVGEPEYYTYDYQAKKPFKTLPEKDLIRVYDKIPVRSFAQEVSGNRVIYGNFQNKHTAPDSLNYNVGITEKSTFNLNETTIDYTGGGGVFPRGTPIDVDFSGELFAGRVITSTNPGVIIPDGTVVSSTNNNGEGVSVSGNSTFSSGSTATILVNNMNGFIPVGATVSGSGIPVGVTVVSIESQTQSEATLNVSQLISFSVNDLFTFTSSSKTEAVLSLSRDVTFPAGPVALELNPGGDIQDTTSIIEYPNHSLKTNRNYQVGVVLSDRFGRQSGVILSNNKELKTINGQKFIGSTVYSPYNTKNIDPDDWRGNSLKVLFNETIGVNMDRAIGIPGVYNGDPTSDDYNPLGWYTFKIVVKQTEQEYYNVYLPGIMAAYPEDTTLEVGKTSHAVLISDNINKVPRDLSEVGPVQDQFRSSVMLYGRVENSSTEVTVAGTNIGLSNIQYYPGRTFDTASTVSTVADLFDFNPQDPPNPNLFPQFYSLESNPYIARINTANKIGQIADVNFNAVSAIIAVTATTDTLQITSISGDGAEIEIGDSVVGAGFPTDLVVFGSGFTQGSAAGQNWEIAGTGFTGSTVEFVSPSGSLPIVAGQTMNTQTGIPEGTVVLSVNLQGGAPNNVIVEVNNVVQLSGGDLVGFTEPSTLQVSTPVSVTLGEEINVYSSESPGIQFLAVYETEAVESLLDIFWETSTTGKIQDLNDIITNENPTGTGGGISNWNDNTFTEALRTGENVLNAPIYLVDNFGATISSNDINTPLSLDSAVDDNGLNVQTAFSSPAFYLEETTAGSFEYNLKVGAGFSTIYYGLDEGARNFTLTFSAVINNLSTGEITETLSLGNVSPHIPTLNGNSFGFRSLKPQTSVTDVKLYTGPESVPSGLDVTSAGFPAGTTVVSYSPVGPIGLQWGIKDTVVDSFTYVTYLMDGDLGDIVYLSPSYPGNVDDGTYVTNIQVDTPVAGQVTVTVSKEVTIGAFQPTGVKISYRTPGNLEVSVPVDVVAGQAITATDTSELWDDCPLPPFYPGGTNVRAIGELKAVNGKGWRVDDILPVFDSKTKDLTFNITQERRGVGTPGEEVISPGYFALENPGVALFGSAAKIDLVNTGYQNTNMPNDVYTIDFEVSDPGDSIACQVTVNTGIVICEVQEWTVNGFYSTSCSSNQSNGTPYEGKFIFVRVCDPNGGLIGGDNFNGWYAYLSGSNTNDFTGDFPSWNNLISSNGSSNLTISPSGGTGTANFATSGWTTRSLALTTADLQSAIDSNDEITGGCLVYDNPRPVWTLTAGDGSSTPLVPSRSNYLFTID